MTTIRKIPTSLIDGGDPNNTSTNEIRPFGELAVYIDNENNGGADKLELLMFDGVRTHLRSKVLAKGTFYGGDADSADQGDGIENLDTIKLIPDAELHYNDGDYGNDQYIVIDPTLPNHIHIRAGGAIDNSNALLFLGGEENNVMVSDNSDQVTIRTNDTNQWLFGSDGALTVPGDLHGAEVFLGGEQPVPIVIGHTLNITPAPNASDKKFGFRIDQSDTDGEFLAALLEMPTAENNKSVSISFAQTDAIGDNSLGYIWNQGTDTNETSLNNAFNIFANNTNIKLTTQDSNSNKSTWTFGTDGLITLPDAGKIASDGNVKISSGNGLQIGSTITIATDSSEGTGSGTPGVVDVPFDGTLYTAYPAGSTITFANGDVRTITSIAQGNVGLYQDINYSGTATASSPEFPITLKTANYAPAYTPPEWSFGATGNLTLPQTAMNSSPAPVSWPGITFSDGTFQNTASIGDQLISGNSIVVLDSTGTLTLPSGGTITEGGGFTGAIKFTPAGGANEYQALVIYPTAAAPDGDHVHLTAGGGTTELYLGNDIHYVKLVNGGNVEIAASTSNVSASSSWTFGTDGRLINLDGLNLTAGGQFNICTLLAGGSGYENGNSTSVVTGGSGTGMVVGYGFGLEGQVVNVGVVDPGTGYQDGDVLTMSAGNGAATFVITRYNSRANQGNSNFIQSEWTFGDDGKLTLPSDSSILTNETALNIATHSTATYTFNQAYWEALNANVTRMFTPSSNAQYFACTVTANQNGAYTVNIIGNGGVGLVAGNWFKIPGNQLGGATPDNDIQITVATVNGSGAILTTTITGTAVGKQWQFGQSGNTTFPTGLVLGAPRGVNTVNFTSAIDKEFQIETQTASTGKLWRFGTDGKLSLPTVPWNYVPTTFTAVPVTYGATTLTFTVLLDNTITNMSVAQGAGGYGPGSVELTIPGTTFSGGTTPANDIVFDVTTFESAGPVFSTTTSSVVTYVLGTLPTRYNSIDSAGAVGIGAGGQHWTFSTNGTLTFPNNTQQTTAWTGAIPAPANGDNTSGSAWMTFYADGALQSTSKVTINPATSMLTINGNSGTGGITFPDNTVQTTASVAGATGPQGNVGYTGSVGSFSGTTSSQINTSNATVSTSTTTGALVVAGGAGIGGEVFVGGNVTATAATATITSTAASVGYMGVPQNSQSGNYTFVIGDAGKHILMTASGNLIIPPNSSVPFPVGTTFDIVTYGGVTTTIAASPDFIILAGVGFPAGTRTLSGYGWATLIKIEPTAWIIRGEGLS